MRSTPWSLRRAATAPMFFLLASLSACTADPVDDDDTSDDDVTAADDDTADVDDATEPTDDDATEPTDDDATEPADDDDDDTTVPDDDDTSASEADLDPFAPMPDTSEGLVNVSDSLTELLENGQLDGACDEWAADPDDRRKELLCGKSMFFYEGFGQMGVPTALFDFMATRFPDSIGPGFSNYGLVQDPYSAEGRPLGVPPGAPMADGTIPTLAFGCANCHFGQLPDGRYAVGAPNLEYEYGKLNLAIMLAPSRAMPGWNEAEHAPAAVEAVRPVLDALGNDFLLQLEFLWAMASLLGAVDEIPPTDAETEAAFADFLPGTLDFVMSPLPIDDGVLTISKIIDLWGIPDPDEEDLFGMSHGHLAWTGSAETLEQFVTGAVVIGGGPMDEWPAERIAPLVNYIRSLRAPDNPDPAPVGQIEGGRKVFWDEGCAGCHGGPRGSGTTTYSFEEIGTDDAMRYWGDPDLTGDLCCGLDVEGDGTLSHAIKSPRLTGLWAKTRFLHNGSVESLEELLCVDGPRDPIDALAYGNGGHEFGCELDADAKTELLAFLGSL